MVVVEPQFGHLCNLLDCRRAYLIAFNRDMDKMVFEQAEYLIKR
jgi:hypothetical protein